MHGILDEGTGEWKQKRVSLSQRKLARYFNPTTL